MQTVKIAIKNNSRGCELHFPAAYTEQTVYLFGYVWDPSKEDFVILKDDMKRMVDMSMYMVPMLILNEEANCTFQPKIGNTRKSHVRVTGSTWNGKNALTDSSGIQSVSMSGTLL